MKLLETIKHSDYPLSLSLWVGRAVQLKETAKVIATNRIQPKKKPYRFPALSSPFVTHQASDNTSAASSGTSSRLKLLFVFIFLILGNAVFIPMANASTDGDEVCRAQGRAYSDSDTYAVCATPVDGIIGGETVTLNGYGFAGLVENEKAQVKWFKWEQVSGPDVEIINIVNANDDGDAGDTYGGDGTVSTSAQYTVPDVVYGGVNLVFKLTARIDIGGGVTDFNISVNVTHNILGGENAKQDVWCAGVDTEYKGKTEYAVCAISERDIEIREIVTLNGFAFVNEVFTDKFLMFPDDFIKGQVKWFKWEQVSGPTVELRNIVNANGDDDAGDSYGSVGYVYTSAQYTASDVDSGDGVLVFKLTMRVDLSDSVADFNISVNVTHNVVLNTHDPVITVQ